MATRVQRWGNSLAVRLPRQTAEKARISEGSEVELVAADGQIIVRPVRPVIALDDLLKDATPSRLHGETDWGAPVGKEIW